MEPKASGSIQSGKWLSVQIFTSNYQGPRITLPDLVPASLQPTFLSTTVFREISTRLSSKELFRHEFHYVVLVNPRRFPTLFCSSPARKVLTLPDRRWSLTAGYWYVVYVDVDIIGYFRLAACLSQSHRTSRIYDAAASYSQFILLHFSLV
jgi:hypothetical protein